MKNNNEVKANTQTAKGTAQLSEDRVNELLAKINTKGGYSRTGKWSLGADVDKLNLVTRQVQLYAGIIIRLGGNATPNQIDDFSITSDGALKWAYANGTAYEQTPSKIMFGTYMAKAIGQEEWSKKIGKLEIIRYTP